MQRHDVRPRRCGFGFGQTRCELQLESRAARSHLEAVHEPALVSLTHVDARKARDKVTKTHPERPVVRADVPELRTEFLRPHLAPGSPLAVPFLATPRIAHPNQAQSFVRGGHGSRRRDRLGFRDAVLVLLPPLRAQRLGERGLPAHGQTAHLAHVHHRVRVASHDAPRGVAPVRRAAHGELRGGVREEPRPGRVVVDPAQAQGLRRASRQVEQSFRDPPAADGVVRPVCLGVRLFHQRHPQLVPRGARVRGLELVLVRVGFSFSRPSRVRAAEHLRVHAAHGQTRVHHHTPPLAVQEQPEEVRTSDVRARGDGVAGGERLAARREHEAVHEVGPFRDHRERAEEPAVAHGALPHVAGPEPRSARARFGRQPEPRRVEPAPPRRARALGRRRVVGPREKRTTLFFFFFSVVLRFLLREPRHAPRPARVERAALVLAVLEHILDARGDAAVALGHARRGSLGSRVCAFRAGALAVDGRRVRGERRVLKAPPLAGRRRGGHLERVGGPRQRHLARLHLRLKRLRHGRHPAGGVRLWTVGERGGEPLEHIARLRFTRKRVSASVAVAVGSRRRRLRTRRPPREFRLVEIGLRQAFPGRLGGGFGRVRDAEETTDSSAQIASGQPERALRERGVRSRDRAKLADQRVLDDRGRRGGCPATAAAAAVALGGHLR